MSNHPIPWKLDSVGNLEDSEGSCVALAHESVCRATRARIVAMTEVVVAAKEVSEAERKIWLYGHGAANLPAVKAKLANALATLEALQ